VRTLTAQLADLKRRHREETQQLRQALETAHGENLELRRRTPRRAHHRCTRARLRAGPGPLPDASALPHPQDRGGFLQGVHTRLVGRVGVASAASGDAEERQPSGTSVPRLWTGTAQVRRS
jgi:hypothetical protein